MSDNDSEVAEIIYNVQISIIDNYCMIAAATLIIFEYFATICHEIELVWYRKITGATILFLLNRWFNIGVAVGLVILIPNYSTQPSCEAVNLFLPVFQELLLLVWAAFSAVRVYAVGGRDWRPAAVVFLLGLVPIATNLYGDIKMAYTTIDIPVLGIFCNNIPYVSEATSNILMIITRVCLIASDAIVLLVTWTKTYQIKKDADRVNMKASLVTLLLRDGTLYFVLLLILNILHMTLYLTNVFFDMIYFVGPISSIIISRFLLNLRQVYQTDDSDDARPSFVRSNVSDICFAAAIVGNLGAPLSYGESRTSRSETTTFVTGISDVDTTSPASEYGFDLIEPPQMAKDPLRVDLDLISTSEDIELAHT